MNGILIQLDEKTLRSIIRESVAEEISNGFAKIGDNLASSRSLPNGMNPADFLTITEASKTLRVSKTTLNRYEHAGILRPVRIGRRVLYRRADVERVLNGERQGKRS